MLHKRPAVAQACATAALRPATAIYLPQWNAFEDMLIRWALDHFPDAVRGIEAKWGDVPFEKKCLGAIFRRQCKVDPAWLWRALRTWPKEILRLSPSIGSIELAGVKYPPPQWNFSQWIDSVQTVEGAEQQAANAEKRAKPTVKEKAT